MSSEIEQAAERWRNGWYADLQQSMTDAHDLAQWAVARLAADRAEAEKRARPLDDESFTRRGFGPETINGRSLLLDGPGEICELWIDASGEVSVAQGDDLVAFCGMPDVTTEGQLDDLLRVLKGGA